MKHNVALKMDDDAALSAANLTQEVSDDYEEEGFDQLQLLDRPWTLPLPNQPSDPIEPVLRMHTRRQRALAGEIEFPPCKDNLCLGCRPSCKEAVGQDVQLWCNLCQKERTTLCRRRARCIQWDDQQFQRFSDLQSVHEVLQPMDILTQATDTVTQAAEELVAERRRRGEQQAAAEIEQRKLEEEAIALSPPADTPAIASGKEATHRQDILSIKPRVTSTPSRSTDKVVKFQQTGETEAPYLESSHPQERKTAMQVGEGADAEDLLRGGEPPRGGGLRRVESSQELRVLQPSGDQGRSAFEAPRLTLNRVYGASALSPSPLPQNLPPFPTQQPHRTPDGEARLNSNTVFAARGGDSRRRGGEWDGQGLPQYSDVPAASTWWREQQKTFPQAPDSLWTRRDQMQRTAEESFYSPMQFNSGEEEPVQQRIATQRPRMVLQPPRFVPPTTTISSFHPPTSTLRRPAASFFEEQTQREHMPASNSNPIPIGTTPKRGVGEQRRRLIAGRNAGGQEIPELGGEEEEEGESWGQGGGGMDSQGTQLEIAKILEKLTTRLDQPPVRANPPQHNNQQSSLKMPSLVLPSIRRSATNEVTARSYFSWKLALSTVVNLHGVNPDSVLICYATTPKLLPEEYITIMANSGSLAEAIESLDTLHPSLASIRPELVRALTDLPPLQNASEKTRVHRISTLLRLLDEFLKYFGASPHRDLTRQDILVILYHFYGSSESRAELVKEVVIMEEAKQRGTMYAESLKKYLTRIRTVLVDVISALQLVGKTETPSRGKSAATRIEKKVEKEAARTTIEKKNGASCLICKGFHPTFSCHEQLKLIKEGKKKLGGHICASCLGEKKQNHPPDCAIRRSLKDNVYVLTNFKCSQGSGAHFRICGHPSCGPQQAVDQDQSKPQRSAAARVKQLEGSELSEKEDIGATTACGGAAALSAANADAEEDAVVFLAENLYLLGRDGQTKQCVVSYDNHGSKTFLSGQLSDDFLHSEPERRQFQIDTVQGKDVTCRNIYKLQLLTLKGRLELEAVASNWVEPSEEPQLDQATAELHQVHVPEVEDQQGEALPRIILSAAWIHLHPRAVTPAASMLEIHPKLGMFRSRLSNRLICAGALGPSSSNC